MMRKTTSEEDLHYHSLRLANGERGSHPPDGGAGNPLQGLACPPPPWWRASVKLHSNQRVVLEVDKKEKVSVLLSQTLDGLATGCSKRISSRARQKVRKKVSKRNSLRTLPWNLRFWFCDEYCGGDQNNSE